MKEKEIIRFVVPKCVDVIKPTKQENKAKRTYLGKQRIDLGDDYYEPQIYNTTIFNMITCDKYYYGEDNYGLSCFRTIAWEDLNTYDFIKYDGKSFKFIYFEDDRDGYPSYSVIHIKKEYINKMLGEFNKLYDGYDESLNAIIVSVFKKLFNGNYGQVKIVNWLDSIGVECYHYHFYILEKGIDL